MSVINAILLAFLSFFLQAGTIPPSDTKPLPELDPFLQDIRQHLDRDSVLQSQYTFTEKS